MKKLKNKKILLSILSIINLNIGWKILMSDQDLFIYIVAIIIFSSGFFGATYIINSIINKIRIKKNIAAGSGKGSNSGSGSGKGS